MDGQIVADGPVPPGPGVHVTRIDTDRRDDAVLGPAVVIGHAQLGGEPPAQARLQLGAQQLLLPEQATGIDRPPHAVGTLDAVREDVVDMGVEPAVPVRFVPIPGHPPADCIEPFGSSRTRSGPQPAPQPGERLIDRLLPQASSHLADIPAVRQLEAATVMNQERHLGRSGEQTRPGRYPPPSSRPLRQQQLPRQRFTPMEGADELLGRDRTRDLRPWSAQPLGASPAILGVVDAILCPGAILVSQVAVHPDGTLDPHLKQGRHLVHDACPVTHPGATVLPDVSVLATPL